MALAQRRIIPASELRAFESALTSHCAQAGFSGPLYKSFAVEFTGNEKSGKEGGGCSNGCRFCGVSAPRGPTHFMPWELVESIIKVSRTRPLFPEVNSVLSHLRSDLFDYSYEGRTALDIIKFSREVNVELGIVTAIPRGTEDIVVEAIKQGEILSISLYMSNESRILSHERLIRELSARQISLKKVSIPAIFFLADASYNIESREAHQISHAVRKKLGNNFFIVNPQSTIQCGVPVLYEGRLQYAYFYHPSRSEIDQTKLTSVSGSEQFSSLVHSGVLLPETLFSLEYVSVPLPGPNDQVKIRPRSWNVSPIGRSFDGSFAGLKSPVIDSSCPALLVDCHGGIYRIESVPLSWENREGMLFTQIRPPIC
jgi:hypothetical protein